MNKLEVDTVDIIRAMKDDLETSVKEIVDKYYISEDIHPSRYSQIRECIITNHWGGGTLNDKIVPNRIMIDEYLITLDTDEYKLDRCFDILFRHRHGGAIMPDLIERQKITCDDTEMRVLQSEMIESGLIDTGDEMDGFKLLTLNSNGFKVLKVFDKYSDYKNDLAIREYEESVKNQTMYMTEEKRKEYHDEIIIHLAKPENRNNEFVFDKLYEDLNLPTEYRIGVWKKLSAQFKVALIDVLKQLKNSQSPIKIRQEGIEYANALNKKNEVVDRHKLIEGYKVNALNTIKEHGIGSEAVWKNIAKKAGIPDECSDDIKNLLYNDGFMIKTKAAQGLGDLIRGMPSISVYLLGLPTPTPSMAFTDNSTHVYGHSSQVAAAGATVTGSFNKNEESAETKKLAVEQLKDIQKNKWYRHWGFIVTIAGLLLALLLWLIDRSSRI